jgi:hypothetical protein
LEEEEALARAAWERTRRPAADTHDAGALPLAAKPRAPRRLPPAGPHSAVGASEAAIFAYVHESVVGLGFFLPRRSRQGTSRPPYA